MRTRAGKLIADLNDKIGAVATASLPIGNRSDIDENQTTYRLFPYELNDPPIFTQNIFEASTPRIVSDLGYSPTKTDVMYRDEDNTVKVLVGSSFVFKVAAQQPNILNVENGIPLIFQPSADLTYTWFKDDEMIFVSEGELEADLEPRKDKLQQVDNELIFTSVSPRMAGQYTCVVANDIGESTSEVINLEVRNPKDPEDAFFKQNIIENGFARDDTNGWTVVVGDATTGKFASSETDLELKRPNTNIFGHSAGEIYPHPSNIKFEGIKNYKIASLLNEDAQYFTRGTINHTINGGTRQAIMYQDVDLSEITDYISGRVYGCNGVRAYFGSIIGNALTRFIPTIDLVSPNLRYKPEYYYTGAPRISYENFILTGYGICDERVTITIQEYEGATRLPSIVYRNGTTEVVDAIQLTDTLSTLKNQLDRFNEPVLPPTTNPITTVEGIQYTPAPLTNSYPLQAQRYLNIYKELYGNKLENYYSHGQYADYQDAIIRVLNPSTNKVRITIKFELNDWALHNEILPKFTSDGILQMQTWSKPMFKLLPREYNSDIWTIINQNTYDIFKDKPLSDILQTIKPRTMVTGMGLILEPLTPTSIGVADFRNQISTIIPKEQEVRPKAANPLAVNPTPFETVAQNVTGLSQVLTFNGQSMFFFIRKYRDVDTNDWAGGVQSYFYTSDFEDKDREYHNGDFRIQNLTTGELWYSNFYRKDTIKYSEDWAPDDGLDPSSFPTYAPKQFAGLQTIRITVNAQGTTSGEDGDQDKERPRVYPWLLLKLTNTTDLLSPNNNIYYVNAYPNPNLDFTQKSLNPFSPLANKVGRNANEVRARKIVVDIPSNCLVDCIAGLRNNNNNPYTDGTVYSKFDFTGPNGELQYFRY